MTGFNSNFSDIQKQISFANLTDEQILELLSILQTKRNAKPKLTKEEKVFLQCCRERRSYSANKHKIPLKQIPSYPIRLKRYHLTSSSTNLYPLT